MDAKNILIALSIKYNGDWTLIFNAVNQYRSLIDESELEAILNKTHCKAITILDSEYPERLRQVYRPPFVLFYQGDLSLLSNIDKCLAVVGSRKANEKFKNKTREIVKQLNNDILIVSGLAAGIDGVAHQAALDSGKKTIAVIGSGLNYCFPTENEELCSKIKKNNLVITEYPDSVPPKQENFPPRNRIIAGLSDVVLIPEAAKKSGSVITAGYAINLGKEILCLPSENFGDSACNLFLKEGARLVESADDVNDFFR